MQEMKKKSFAKVLLGNSQATLILGIALLSAIVFIGNPVFIHPSNLLNIGVSCAVSGIMVTGLAIAMISGSMDVSQYALGALVAMIVAVLNETMSVPIGLAVLAGLLVSVLAGVFNGLMITKLKMFPLIATLGASYIFRAMAYIMTDSKSVMLYNVPMKNIVLGKFLGVQNVIWYMAICFALCYFILKYTPFGRRIFAVGGNPDAARLSGINVDRTRIIAQVICALMAGIGGIVNSTQVAAAIPTQGNGADLDNVVAVVLGGVSIAGGGGRVVGTLLGVIFMGILKNGLTLLNVQSYYQTMARGIVLLVAVALDTIRRKYSD